MYSPNENGQMPGYGQQEEFTMPFPQNWGGMKAEAPEPPAPLSENGPGRVFANRRYGDRLCLAGFTASTEATQDLMLVATSVVEEETDEVRKNGMFGRTVHQKPRAFRGVAANLLTNLLDSVGISRKEYFYTSLIRWLIPKKERTSPKAQDVRWATPALIADIEKAKPKVIVTFGKPAFEALVDVKLKASDLEGGWFTYKHDPAIAVYPMPDLFRLATKPTAVEDFRVDIVEVSKMVMERRGVVIPKVPLHYRTITNSTELRAWVQEVKMKYFVFSTDCEWHGTNHVDGELRSIQFAWKPGHAVYVKFRDETRKYTFDVSYEEAGAIMNEVMDMPMVRYVGHHIAADFPWMHHVLKMNVEGRCILDTEFATQCLNEHDSLSLERVGMKGTDLGRYDLDLVLWKKKAGKKATEFGYGYVPDDVIIPYACKDVDVPIRVYASMIQKLKQQNLWEYYNTLFCPFTTDVFTQFSIEGLPVNRKKMEDMRELFHYVYGLYEKKVIKLIQLEAADYLQRKLTEITGNAGLALEIMCLGEGAKSVDDSAEFQGRIKAAVGPANVGVIEPFVQHYLCSKNFKVKSSEMLKRWLFDVKGFTPIKTTGKPSISWEKVKTFSAAAQKEYQPATDKQTIKIIADTTKDVLLNKLLDLNSVGSLCRAFLGKADLDAAGEVEKENGLLFYTASDDRVHGQYSATETGRPRSWKPNALNWPSYVNERIERAIGEILAEDYTENRLPERFRQYIKIKDGKVTAKPPSIRSVVEAFAGWLIVESDYQTAELRGLAYISGDAKMISLMNDPDTQFGLVQATVKGKAEEVPVRLCYGRESGIDKRDPRYLFHYMNDAGELVKVLPSQLLRDASGKLRHPKADLHWSLAELVHSAPREGLNNKRDRGAAKVGNFSSIYGASDATLEMKIEADTGIKPEEGTGKRLKDALYRRQTVASEFLEGVAQAPKTKGFLVAASGRIRHFVLPSMAAGFSARAYDTSASAQGREARNFFMQESVAATAMRAAVRMLKFKRQHKLRGFTVSVLYDSVVTCCPEEEKHIWKKAHKLFMFVDNTWEYHGRLLAYPIDTEYNAAWSDSKPEPKVAEWLYSPVKPENKAKFAHIEAWLDAEIARAEAVLAQNELDQKQGIAK